MKIEPIGQQQAQVTSPGTPSASQQSARERAIKALMGGQNQAQQIPVQNPSQISPEEMTAIQKPSTETVDVLQNNTSESEEQKQSLEPKEEPKAKDEQLSTQYAILARKEKALRAKMQQQEAEYKAKEAAIQAREEALKAKDLEYQSKYIPKDRLTQDTWNTLAEAGITYDQLTQLALNPPAPENPAQRAAFQKLQAEIESLKNAQEEVKRSYENQQQQSYKQAVNQIRIETKQLINNDPGFETIKATNSVNDVVELIEKTFKAEGVLLSVEEAAQAVEDYLVEEAVKYAQLKKVQSKLQSASQKMQAQQKPQDQKQPQQQTMKTLTNAVSSTGKLSARDRAILAFKGQKA